MHSWNTGTVRKRKRDHKDGTDDYRRCSFSQPLPSFRSVSSCLYNRIQGGIGINEGGLHCFFKKWRKNLQKGYSNSRKKRNGDRSVCDLSLIHILKEELDYFGLSDLKIFVEDPVQNLNTEPIISGIRMWKSKGIDTENMMNHTIWFTDESRLAEYVSPIQVSTCLLYTSSSASVMNIQ